MLNLLAAGALAVSMLGSPIISVPDDPVPGEKITVSLVTLNGSGCPQDTATIAVAPDNTAFTVVYSAYLAQVGVGALPTDFRKNCQMAVQVHVPHGFTYAIARADYRGYAYLEPGATGTQRANYYFTGMSGTTFTNFPFTGPMDGYWQNTDEAQLEAASYLPCGEQRYLNINTELRVNAGTSDRTTTTSLLTMDSSDMNISTTYHFSWKSCNEEV